MPQRPTCEVTYPLDSKVLDSRASVCRGRGNQGGDGMLDPRVRPYVWLGKDAANLLDLELSGIDEFQ